MNINEIKLKFNNDIDGVEALKILEAVAGVEIDTEVEIGHNWKSLAGEAESAEFDGFVEDIIKEMKQSSWYYWRIYE